LTNTASFPFLGPATNHKRNTLFFTIKVADAPVLDAAWKAPPSAVRLFADAQIVVIAGVFCVVDAETRLLGIDVMKGNISKRAIVAEPRR
jgi:hypothetical protein